MKEGQRSAAYVDRNHSPEKIVELYEQVFEELVKPGSSSPPQAVDRSEHADSGDPQR
jgi:hypothetical protein